MKIQIEQHILNHNLKPKDVKLSLRDCVLCWLIGTGYNPTSAINNLLFKGVLSFDKEGKLRVFRKYSDIINLSIAQSNNSIPKQSNIEKLAEKLIEIYPHELLKDDNGHDKYWLSSNKKDVTTRLNIYFNEYGVRSDEDIINATKQYVERFSTNKLYMASLANFILKNGESTLETEIENLNIK